MSEAHVIIRMADGTKHEVVGSVEVVTKMLNASGPVVPVQARDGGRIAIGISQVISVEPLKP